MDSQTILSRYQSGIQQGGAKWLAGMQAMTVNPAALAASPQGMANWLAGVNASVDKRRASLSKVSLADIQSAAQQYGQTNYQASATKAGVKYAKKLPGLMNLWTAQKAAANAIPRVPGTDNIGRVQAVVKLAMAARGKL